MNGYHVTLENSGGELDGRYAANEKEISGAIIALASDCIFADGDIIRIIKTRIPKQHPQT